jgi:predicted GNAT family acetyltransferase
MTAATDDLRVIDNPSRSRYELRLDGHEVGFLDYREQPGARILLHAEVDRSRQGQGLGTQLAAGAVDDVRARGLAVVPVCSFVADYVRRQGVRSRPRG